MESEDNSPVESFDSFLAWIIVNLFQDSNSQIYAFNIPSENRAAIEIAFSEEGLEKMFPSNIWDVSLLLALVSIVLLVISEFVNYNPEIIRLSYKEKMQKAAVAFTICYLTTVAIRIAYIVLGI